MVKATLGLVVALAVCGCPGGLGDKQDSAWAPFDMAISDGRAGEKIAKDSTASDRTASDRTRDTKPVPPCTSWSDWTCQEHAYLQCEASCNKGGTTLGLSCIKSGSCVCGLSRGPCGTFPITSTACDTCKQAVEQGCCEPKAPDAGAPRG
jgi:hypothetical protein